MSVSLVRLLNFRHVNGLILALQVMKCADVPSSGRTSLTHYTLTITQQNHQQLSKNQGIAEGNRP
jgi:hypothetical protein